MEAKLLRLSAVQIFNLRLLYFCLLTVSRTVSEVLKHLAVENHLPYSDPPTQVMAPSGKCLRSYRQIWCHLQVGTCNTDPYLSALKRYFPACGAVQVLSF